MRLLSSQTAKMFLLVIMIAFFIVQPIKTQCFGENCKMGLKDSVGGKYTIKQIVQAIDLEIRRVYWYYLDKAIQIFQSNVELPNKQIIHFFIYRNKIGTFLTTISRKKDTIDVNVNNFVRLGNGFTGDTASRTQPISVQPYIIAIKLSPHQLILDDNSTETMLDEESKKANEEAKKLALQNKINKIDGQLRKTYWYYLDRAYLMNSSSLQTNEKVYVVLNYINITGTYMIMASINDKTGGIEVNTFVRIGSGAATNEPKSIILQPNMVGAN